MRGAYLRVDWSTHINIIIIITSSQLMVTQMISQLTRSWNVTYALTVLLGLALRGLGLRALALSLMALLMLAFRRACNSNKALHSTEYCVSQGSAMRPLPRINAAKCIMR